MDKYRELKSSWYPVNKKGKNGTVFWLKRYTDAPDPLTVREGCAIICLQIGSIRIIQAGIPQTGSKAQTEPKLKDRTSAGQRNHQLRCGLNFCRLVIRDPRSRQRCLHGSLLRHYFSTSAMYCTDVTTPFSNMISSLQFSDL